MIELETVTSPLADVISTPVTSTFVSVDTKILPKLIDKLNPFVWLVAFAKTPTIPLFKLDDAPAVKTNPFVCTETLPL